MNYNDLGLLAKGLLAVDRNSELVDLCKQSRIYRHLTPEAEKALTSTAGSSDLVYFDSQSSSFLSSLHNSIIDSVKTFRLAPARTNIFTADGVVIGIVAEKQPLPVASNVRRHFLEYVKTGSIQVFTQEQIGSTANLAESFITRELRNIATACSNAAFIDLLLTTDSNTETIASEGNTAVQILSTIASAFDLMDTRETSSFVLLVHHKICKRLAAKTTTSGESAFPNLNASTGGELFNGLRVIPIGDNQLPSDDSDGAFCVLFDADSILMDKGSIYLGRSESATLEMSDAPDGSNPIVSLFQSDGVALKVVRDFAAEQIRNGAVKITGVEW